MASERDIRYKTFLRWCNFHLSGDDPTCPPVLKSLEEGLATSELLRLVCKLCEEPYVPTKDNRKDVAKAFGIMDKHHVRVPCTRKQILKAQSTTPALQLVHSLVLHFTILCKHVKSQSGRKASSMEGQPSAADVLLQWVRSQTTQPPVSTVTDMAASWRDGKLLYALVRCLVPDSLDVTTPQDPAAAAEAAIAAAQHILGAPAVLKASELVSPDCDNLSIMAYIGCLRLAVETQMELASEVASESTNPSSPVRKMIKEVPAVDTTGPAPPAPMAPGTDSSEDDKASVNSATTSLQERLPGNIPITPTDDRTPRVSGVSVSQPLTPITVYDDDDNDDDNDDDDDNKGGLWAPGFILTEQGSNESILSLVGTLDRPPRPGRPSLPNVARDGHFVEDATPTAASSPPKARDRTSASLGHLAQRPASAAVAPAKPVYETTQGRRGAVEHRHRHAQHKDLKPTNVDVPGYDYPREPKRPPGRRRESPPCYTFPIFLDGWHGHTWDVPSPLPAEDQHIVPANIRLKLQDIHDARPRHVWLVLEHNRLRALTRESHVTVFDVPTTSIRRMWFDAGLFGFEARIGRVVRRVELDMPRAYRFFARACKALGIAPANGSRRHMLL